MAKLASIELNNYKKHKNFKVEFEGSNLFLIQGPNGSGKTTILNAIDSLLLAKDDTPNKVTSGEKKGTILGKFLDGQGNELSVKQSFTDSKNKYILTYDNNISEKVGDIRNIFRYNAFTAEEFIAWSNTQSGRDKQIEVLLSIIPEETRLKYFEYVELEDKLVETRKLNKKELAVSSTLLNKIEITEADIELTSKKDAVDKQLKSIKEKRDNINTLKITKQNLEDTKVNFSSNIESAIYEVKDEVSQETMQEFNKLVDLVVKHYDVKLDEIGELDDIEEIDKKISRGEDMQNNIRTILDNIEKQKEYQKEVDILTEKVNQNDKDIIEARQNKETTLSGADNPVPELIINNAKEGLSIITKDGEFPFNVNQVSTSVITLITLKILYHINKTTPIILLGRLESFDDNSIDKIIAFAKDNDCQIIADKVTNDDDIYVEVIVGSEKGTKIKVKPTKKAEPKVEPVKEKIKEKKVEAKVAPSKNEIAEQEELF